jgi:cell wall-associated NlpC family hydrolase
MPRSPRALAACLLALLMPVAPAMAQGPARVGGETARVATAAAVGPAGYDDEAAGVAPVTAQDGDEAAGVAPAAPQEPGRDGGAGRPRYHEQPAPADPADWLPAFPPGQPTAQPPWVPLQPVLPTTTQTTVAGRAAMLRVDGRAAIPRDAPKRVRSVIAAANRIIGKPYKWGGGHLRLNDSGYDCSGAVSYALIRSGVQRGAMVSGQLAHAYAAGLGRYVSIYANRTHVYMEIAGLRLDTSPYGDVLRQDGVRWRPVVGQRQGFAIRHLQGL